MGGGSGGGDVPGGPSGAVAGSGGGGGSVTGAGGGGVSVVFHFSGGKVKYGGAVGVAQTLAVFLFFKKM